LGFEHILVACQIEHILKNISKFQKKENESS